MSIKSKVSATIIAILLALCALMALNGCGNRQLIDTTYKYTYAYIEVPGVGGIGGKCSSWKDYSDSDQIQVVIDGITYFTDSTRCVLTTNKIGE